MLDGCLMTEIRYTAEIKGHEPPFKWIVQRRADDSVTNLAGEYQGEADSYAEALFQAHESARVAEWRRKYNGTKRVEELFTVPRHEVELKPPELVSDP